LSTERFRVTVNGQSIRQSTWVDWNQYAQFQQLMANACPPLS
jgi:hypothetical protein